MTELELYKFCEDKAMDWRGEELVIWVDFSDLEDFTDLLGENYFAEGGLDVQLQHRQVAFDLVKLCESYGIDPTEIFSREN